MLKNKITGLIAVEPQGGKISRAHAAAPEVEAGNVYLPHPALYPWVYDFIDSCTGFPNMANDDDVDAFTQAMIRWQVSSAPIPFVQGSAKIRQR
jgi:predicted phage terminase large subunit-like protein